MNIITKEEVKPLIGISESDTSKDSLIDDLIPIVQNMFFVNTNNYFMANLRNINIVSEYITFSESDKSINDPYETFEYVKPNMVLLVRGSGMNDGFYKVVSVTSGKIIVEESLNDEDFGLEVRLNQSIFDKNIKLVIARMVNVFIITGKEKLKSERFSDYSATYFGSVELQSEIENLIRPYQKIDWS